MTPLHCAPVEIGDGYRVAFSFSASGLAADWTPDLPGPTRKHLIPPYIRARDAFLADVAKINGINIAVMSI